MKTSGTMNSATGHTSVSTRTGNFNDGLYDRAGARPDLDLDFARTKSLRDRVSKEDLITFTRSSGSNKGATYVDENGLVKVAPVNLLKYSEDIRDNSDGTDWNHVELSVTPNNVIAPDGTLTADTPDTDMTRFLVLHYQTGGGSSFIVSEVITNITSEWQRFTRTFTVPSTGNQIRIYPLRNVTTTDDTTNRFFHSNTNIDVVAGETYTYSAWYKRINNINHVWGTQLEKGSVATEYIPTTSQPSGAPRFTHDPVTKESKGLLIEQAVTNLIFPSEDFSGYGFYKSTVTTDQIIAPDGTQTADKLQWINTGGNPIAYKPKPADGIYTISAFFKKGNSDGAFIYADNPAFRCAIFDLENGTTGPKHGTFSNSTIEDFGNGWYRCSATTTAIGGNNVGFGVCEKEQTNTTAVVPSTTDSHNYLWGAQVEAGSVITSYIPTSGSTVTRSADLASIQGDNFGTYRKNLITNTSFRKGSDGWVTTGGFANSTYESYVALSPSGNYDALKVTATGSTSVQHRVQKTLGDIAVSGSTTDLYSISGYFKKGTADRIYFSLWDGNATKAATYADLTNGTTYGTPTGTNVSITDVGQETGDSRLNGWYKIQLTSTQVSSGNASLVVTILDGPSNNFTYTANGESIFVWGFQVELADAPTEFISSTDTYTNRQSNATFVDGNGIIRKSMCNQLLYSEEFDNTYWTKAQVNVTANAGIAPNGTLTADKIISTTADITTHFLYRQINPGGTLSVYAKADGLNYISLVSQLTGQTGGATLAAGVSVNLTNGSIQTIKDGTAEVIDVGDGWYRITFSRTDNLTQVYYLIQPHDGSAAPDHDHFFRVTYAGDGTSGILLWGAMQTNDLTEAGDYYKTTDTISGPPRYSHDPDTLTPTGLYLEPAATNLVTYSEDYSVPVWATNELNVIRIANATTAPDGTQTATKWIANTTAHRHRIQFSIGSTLTEYTASIFAKADEVSLVSIRLGRNITGIESARFDLSTGTIVANGSAITSSSITPYGNGWYRLTLTTTPAIVGAQYFAITENTSDITLAAGDGSSGFFVWGAQVETGPTTTSYIPTSGSTVTRAADTFTSTATEVLDRANGTKPAFYTTEGWTLRCDCKFNNQYKLATLSDGTEPSSHVYNRIFEFELNSVSQFKAFANNFANYVTPRVPILAIFGGTLYAQQVHELGDDMHVVFRYQTNNSNLRVTNTTNNGADTNVTTVKADTLHIGTDGTSPNQMNGTINRFTIWKIPFDETESNPSSSHNKMVKLAN